MYTYFNNWGIDTAQRALQSYSNLYAKNVEQLSTGKRINEAADDVAGAVFTADIKAKIASADSAKQNISDAITLISTTDSALETVENLLQSIRSDFVAATTGTATTAEVDAYQNSINSAIGQIDAISQDTEFNGFTLFDGSQDFVIQTGINDGNTTTLYFQRNTGTNYRGIAIDVTRTVGGSDEGHLVENVPTAGFSIDELSVNSVNVNTYGNDNIGTTANGLDVIDTLISNAGRMRGTLGGYQNALESKLSHITGMQANWETARANREDVDIVEVTEQLSVNDLMRQAAASTIANAQSARSELVLSLLP